MFLNTGRTIEIVTPIFPAPEPPRRSKARARSRTRLWWEIAIVLALGLGQSAVYAIVQLAYRLTDEIPIADQVAQLNPSRSDREIFDLIYQLLAIGFSLVPVLLVCFLLWQPKRPHLARLGLDGTKVGTDVGQGVLLVFAIGVPGLGLYVVGRALGMTVAIDPASIDAYWWTVPVLLLAAARAALQEEVVLLGYLFTRLRQLDWAPWPIIIATSVLRASYHLYQGYPAFFGNLAMGLLFGWLYQRSGRLMPFLVAHFLIDAAVFVGYRWAAMWPELFGLPG